MTRSADERHFWTALGDFAALKIGIIIARDRFSGPVYDPTRGSSGDGRACSKCRRSNRSDARVCSSCGTVLRMVP